MRTCLRYWSRDEDFSTTPVQPHAANTSAIQRSSGRLLPWSSRREDHGPIYRVSSLFAAQELYQRQSKRKRSAYGQTTVRYLSIIPHERKVMNMAYPVHDYHKKGLPSAPNPGSTHLNEPCNELARQHHWVLRVFKICMANLSSPQRIAVRLICYLAQVPPSRLDARSTAALGALPS